MNMGGLRLFVKMCTSTEYGIATRNKLALFLNVKAASHLALTDKKEQYSSRINTYTITSCSLWYTERDNNWF